MGRLSPVSILIAVGLLVPFAASASPVTIDATAISPPLFRVIYPPSTPSPFMSTASVQVLDLDPGTYVFMDEANGAFSFDVDAAGNVSYTAAVGSFVSGGGTNTLTVSGFAVTVDATALTTNTFAIGHVTGSTTSTSFRPTDTVLGITVLPGDYGFMDEASNLVVFMVDGNGAIQVPAGSEDFLFGAGTNALVVRGFDFRVDARPLTTPRFMVPHITGSTTATSFVDTPDVLYLTGIPGTYLIYDVLSNNCYFDLDADGVVQIPSAYTGFMGGDGTTEAEVPGYTLTVDPLGLAAILPAYGISGLFPYPTLSTSVTQDFVGIPGYYALQGPSGLMFFTMALNGLIDSTEPTFEGLPVTGVGTTTLRIGAVNNAPVVTITGPASGTVVAVGTTVNFTGSFTDDAGDTHTAEWTFDGVPQAGVVNESGGTVTASHTFTASGVYLVTLTVTDDENASGTATTVGGLEAMVVVYDPAAGFVTGGGWIQSPAGADVAHPLASGKASFGFESRYKNGATTPSGETKFVFKAGGLSFRSDAYDWLVVAGARAQYKGTGELNDAGGYSFMLTAIDGAVSGGGGSDKFRIKIWNGSGVAYDNQLGAPDGDTPSTVVGGGSIVIHGSPGAAAFEAEAEGVETRPLAFALLPSAPNPMTSAALVRFDLPSRSRVKVVVYDAAGREVARLADEETGAGRRTLRWDGRDRSGALARAGLYLIRMEAIGAGRASFVAERKLAIVR